MLRIILFFSIFFSCNLYASEDNIDEIIDKIKTKIESATISNKAKYFSTGDYIFSLNNNDSTKILTVIHKVVKDFESLCTFDVSNKREPSKTPIECFENYRYVLVISPTTYRISFNDYRGYPKVFYPNNLNETTLSETDIINKLKKAYLVLNSKI